MKTHWQTKKLGDVAILDKKQLHTRNLPYIGMEDIESGTGRHVGSLDSREVKSTSFYFSKDHVLYGRLRPYLNKVLLPNFDGHCSTEVFPIKTSKELEKKFFFYWITSDYIVRKINSTCTGARMPRANMKEVLDFDIPLPSTTEQKRITKLLDEVFEKVAIAKENAEKNLRNSKELFESYLQSVFANSGKDWEEKKLGEVCGFVRGPFGGSLKKSIFKKEGYVVYEQQHAIYNQFTDVRYFVDEKKFNEMRRFELKSGDLIMSCSGTMGKIAIAPDGIKKGIINQALLKLSPRDGLFNEFLKYWMESGVFQDDLKMYTKGAAIKNVVSVKILKEIKILVPNVQEQKSIVKKIKSFSVETERLEKIYEQELADLEELKRSVLSRAFKGEL